MLKIEIDKNGNIKEFKQAFSCDKHLADVFVTLLDMIIIDEYIKISPKDINMSVKEQEKIILKKRIELVEIMRCHEVDVNYIFCDKSSDLYANLAEEEHDNVVLVDIEKEFDEVVKVSKTNNQTEPINALEYYKP